MGLPALAFAVCLMLSCAARASDPCDHQGITTIFFAAGMASTPDGARQSLEAVAASWRDHHRILSITGHVDAQELATAPDLDVLRAAAVRRVLVQHGVGASWIRVAGDGLHGGEGRESRTVSVAAADAGLGCLGPPGRFTAQ